MNQERPGKQERMWAMAAHLAAFAGLVIPLGNVLGPLIVWLIKREEGAFVDSQGKEALNFAISVTIYGAIGMLLIFLFIGVLLLFALFVFWVVAVIMAAVSANDGIPYRYPLTLRFIT
jgi:uncharacterized Tic20 family protein